MFQKICSTAVIYQANIIPSADMSDGVISNDNNLNEILTSDEYECFKTLLMKIVKNRYVQIEGNHIIEIIHKVDHRN